MILDHNGNPVPRRERRRKKTKPTKVLYQCAICLTPYRLQAGEDGPPNMVEDCHCRAYERCEPQPQGNALRNYVGGLAAWLGVS